MRPAKRKRLRPVWAVRVKLPGRRVSRLGWRRRRATWKVTEAVISRRKEIVVTRGSLRWPELRAPRPLDRAAKVEGTRRREAIVAWGATGGIGGKAGRVGGKAV